MSECINLSISYIKIVTFTGQKFSIYKYFFLQKTVTLTVFLVWGERDVITNCILSKY